MRTESSYYRNTEGQKSKLRIDYTIMELKEPIQSAAQMKYRSSHSVWDSWLKSSEVLPLRYLSRSQLGYFASSSPSVGQNWRPVKATAASDIIRIWHPKLIQLGVRIAYYTVHTMQLPSLKNSSSNLHVGRLIKWKINNGSNGLRFSKIPPKTNIRRPKPQISQQFHHFKPVIGEIGR